MQCTGQPGNGNSMIAASFDQPHHGDNVSRVALKKKKEEETEETKRERKRRKEKVKKNLSNNLPTNKQSNTKQMAATGKKAKSEHA